MKINTLNILGITLAILLPATSALPETNRDGDVQISNPYAITTVLSDEGPVIYMRSNQALELEGRGKNKCYMCNGPCPHLKCCDGDLPQCAQVDGNCECRPKGG